MHSVYPYISVQLCFLIFISHMCWTERICHWCIHWRGKILELWPLLIQFTSRIDFLMESEVSFSWLTSRGNKNCHSAEEGNKENPNLILKEVVIYYSRGESSGVHMPEVLFIQISEEITRPHIFFLNLWNILSHLVFVILRRAAELQLSRRCSASSSRMNFPPLP